FAMARKTEPENISGYFRRIFAENPKLLKSRSNDELLLALRSPRREGSAGSGQAGPGEREALPAQQTEEAEGQEGNRGCSFSWNGRGQTACEQERPGGPGRADRRMPDRGPHAGRGGA